jgi:uncharacterized membrane protein
MRASAASYSRRVAHVSSRIRSLDIVRGLIMVLMAIDHVRVYAGVPAGGPNAGVFFTRWVTHFCAPGFVFFAGTSAYLHGSQLPDVASLSRFLLKRGLWLVVLDLVLMRLMWTFNLDLHDYNLAGVLWMIGWCMVALAGLVWLPMRAVAAVGLAIMFGHNLVDPYVRSLQQASTGSSLRWLWQVLYFGGDFRIGESGPRLVILYSLLPWIGVMAAGYAFGQVVSLPPERRRRILFGIGLGAIILFLALRTFNIYGNPQHWGPPQRPGALPAALSFLNTTKYPASLLFLLMTLGPVIALMPLVEHARGRLASALELFGRVPLFYYVVHIPLIHISAIVVSVIRTGAVTPWLFSNFPMEAAKLPEGYRWSLALLYLVTLIDVVILYFACRWYLVKVRTWSEARAVP